MPGGAFGEGGAGGAGGGLVGQRISQIEEPEGAVRRGVEVEPAGEFLGAGGGRGAPVGAEAALVGGKQEILRRAGDCGDFLPFGDFAAGFDLGGERDDGGGVEGVGGEFGAFFRVAPRCRGGGVVDGLQAVGEAGAGGRGGEHMKTPRLGEAVGRGPVGVFEQGGDDLAGNFPGGVHGEGFE